MLFLHVQRKKATMKKKILFLLALPLALAMSCQKPAPTPKKTTKPPGGADTLRACFTIDSPSVCPYETVHFKSTCSKLAVSYLWEFNDGTPNSIDSCPSKSFNRVGNFPIKLTVFNADKTKQQSLQSGVFVGTRHIFQINLNLFAPTDASGAPWDADATGPDVYLKIGPKSDSLKYSSSVIKDIAIQDYPKILYFNSATIPITNEDWVISIFDQDASGTDQYMGSVHFTQAQIRRSTDATPATTLSLKWTQMGGLRDIDVKWTMK